MIKNKELINKTELARILGISSSYVSKLLKGQRKSDKYMKMIQDVLKDNMLNNSKRTKAA